MTGRLVIVGAGQAAFALASKLRVLKDERAITIIGSEDAYPYQRPPLSKKYLLGEMSFDRLMFRPEEWYAENNVDIRLSTWVEEIDRAGKTVRMQVRFLMTGWSLRPGPRPGCCPPASVAISTACLPSVTGATPTA